MHKRNRHLVDHSKDGFGLDRNTAFVVGKCHPGLTDMFVTAARHEYLLSLPLTKEDIKAEALSILSAFQNAQEPNSPNITLYYRTSLVIWRCVK